MHSKKRELLNYLLIIIILFKKIIYKNKVYIVGTPIHGNIGDQAIIYSENLMFKEKYKIKPIEIESYLMKKRFKIIKKIIGKDTIYVHGGGFLGTLWIEEEEMFRTIIKEFPNNRIIVLPQTCFFDSINSKIFMESKKIYGSHSNLVFFAREKYSFEFMKTYFPECNVNLVPDIVLYNNSMNFSKERKDVLCCFRSDKEKKLNFEKEIFDLLEKNNLKISFSDTIVNHKVFPLYRKNEIYKKLKEFSKYKILITDRLHGMVFAYLTKTPCIVIENKSYKVKGLFEWIKKCNFIKLYNEKNFEKDLNELINLKEKKSVQLNDKFTVLYNEIEKDLNYGK